MRPAFRGKGIGKALMARLAKRCVDEGLGALRMGGARLERAVDRVLQVDRRAAQGRVAHLPRLAATRCARLAEHLDADRPHRGGRRQRRDRARRHDAVAAQIRHAPFPRAHPRQAGGDGAQDLSLALDQAAAGPHQYRGQPRCGFHRAGRSGRAEPRSRRSQRRAAMRCGAASDDHGDRRRRHLRAGDAARRLGWRSRKSMRRRKAMRSFRRSIRRSGAKARANVIRPARTTMPRTISSLICGEP